LAAGPSGETEAAFLAFVAENYAGSEKPLPTLTKKRSHFGTGQI